MVNRISAVFDTRDRAEAAIRELRTLGVNDSELSVIARHHEGGGGGMVAEAPVREVDADKTGKGLAAGAGLGALFGLASAFIPGIGPFMAAGTLAATIGTIGASTVAGAVVGGATGALAGALSEVGYTREESDWYAPEIERGGYLVAVDSIDTGLSRDRIWEVLQRHGGRSAPGSAWL